MSHNGKHISEIQMLLLLVKKRGSVENSQVRASLHGNNDIELQ